MGILRSPGNAEMSKVELLLSPSPLLPFALCPPHSRLTPATQVTSNQSVLCLCLGCYFNFRGAYWKRGALHHKEPVLLGRRALNQIISGIRNVVIV